MEAESEYHVWKCEETGVVLKLLSVITWLKLPPTVLRHVLSYAEYIPVKINMSWVVTAVTKGEYQTQILKEKKYFHITVTSIS